MFNLLTPVEDLYLVGPARAKILKKLGIKTLEDLLFYFPRNHQDLSNLTEISKLKPGEFSNIKAEVLELKTFRTKIRRLSLTQALVEDNTGSIVCVWFNQPFLSKVIKAHETYLLSGKVTFVKNSAKGGSASGGKLQIQNPVYEQEKTEQIHTARLVPLYSLTAQITQKQLRTIIKTYLDKVTIPDYLPEQIRNTEKLLAEDSAVKTFHFPTDHPALSKAQKRLAFDEIFQTQVKVIQSKKQRERNRGFEIKNTQLLKEKIEKIPFQLTASQQKILKEIVGDFEKPYPANRLLEGDVGSGKTILAALSMWLMAKNGLQTALLAPTEVLAQQHYSNLLKFFAEDQIVTALLTSSVQKISGYPAAKQSVLDPIASGESKVVFGTHALLEKSVKFKNLGLIVIDEQHRFGVQQRATLKNLHNTHLLTMSATPIPRTLALTLYGDLDISILDQLPVGRKKIKTELVLENNRQPTYDFIRQQIKEGRQAFVICPLIEQSDKLGVKSATAEYEKLKNEIFPDLTIGLLHGRLKSEDKETIMRDFQNDDINILVSTSVIEVGVDVPNATVVMIEGSERFGLAQLHQFRGRVGRSIHQSYCFLYSSDPQMLTNPRLQAFLASENGFELAEKDLQIRGSGDLYGTTQSGYNFRIATLSNLEMVERSRGYADRLLDEDPKLLHYPLLKQKIDNQAAVHLE